MPNYLIAFLKQTMNLFFNAVSVMNFLKKSLSLLFKTNAPPYYCLIEIVLVQGVKIFTLQTLKYPFYLSLP